MYSDSIFCTAIENQKIVHFNYDGYARVVQPHLLGIMRSGTEVLSAFQIDGSSRSGNSIGWKNFAIDKIEDWQETEEIFPNTAMGYNRDDSRMSRILCRI